MEPEKTQQWELMVMGLSPWYFEAFLTSMGAMNNAAAIPSHCFSTQTRADYEEKNSWLETMSQDLFSFHLKENSDLFNLI